MDKNKTLLAAKDELVPDNVQFDDLTEKEAAEFKVLLTKIIESYAKKPEGITDKEWLINEFREEFPEMSDEALEKMNSEVMETIARYDENLADLNNTCVSGKSKESWFEEKSREAAIGMSVLDYGKHLKNLSDSIGLGTQMILEVVFAKGNKTSKSINLDGYVGESDKVKKKALPFTKEQAKNKRTKAQNSRAAQEAYWNNYTTKELALHLGKQAALSGMVLVTVSTGFNLAERVCEETTTDVIMEEVLKTNSDADIKAAVATALIVAGEKGLISVVPKGIPVGIMASFACVIMENLKTFWKVSSEEYSVPEGLDHLGRSTVVLMYRLSWATGKVSHGTAAMLWIAVAGPIVGGLTIGMLGYIAGTKFGQAIYNGVKKVSATKNVIKKIWEGVKLLETKLSVD